MIFDLHLTPRSIYEEDVQPLHLVWDTETGELGPEAAMQLGPIIAAQKRDGTIGISPPPQSIPFDDPTRNPEQLVALLDVIYVLPYELARLYPKGKPLWSKDRRAIY